MSNETEKYVDRDQEILSQETSNCHMGGYD